MLLVVISININPSALVAWHGSLSWCCDPRVEAGPRADVEGCSEVFLSELRVLLALALTPESHPCDR